MGIQEQLMEKYFCKVYKNPEKHDDRLHLCGSGVSKDRHGEYFLIPACYADYIASIFPQYEVGKPFIPEEKGKPKDEK